MESSRRDLFTDMIVDRFSKITKLRPSCFTSILKTGVGLPKTGVGFYCDPSNRWLRKPRGEISTYHPNYRGRSEKSYLNSTIKEFVQKKLCN